MYGNSIYGLAQYGYENADIKNIELYRTNLINYLPPPLQEIKEFKVINSILDDELALLNFTIKDIRDQYYIDTATWGLILWEKRFNVKSDLSKSYEERREIIKAKKRGYGTVTKKLIKDTAEAFSGGEVNIIEHPESYSFTVQFVGIKGIPRNLGAFKDMLDTIKPAHLSYDLKFTYTVWNFIKDKNLTWDNKDNKTWNNLKVYE